MKLRLLTLALQVILISVATTTAWAGPPWTRDRGHFYAQLSYERVFARQLFLSRFEPSPGADTNLFTFCPAPRECAYIQQVVRFYGEVGLISRWLTLTLNAPLVRTNEIQQLGRTRGLSDWEASLWTGLVVKPVRLSLGVTVGIPSGDPNPKAGPGADGTAQNTANSLPTGDGEWDVAGRLSFGASFGRKPAWPLEHFLTLEAGYWARTGQYFDIRANAMKRFSDAFLYRGEFGVKLPWLFVQRFWFIVRLYGFESFADDQGAASGATGLGNGVTALVLGPVLTFRLIGDLHFLGTYERPLRGRSIAAGDRFSLGLYYEY